ncbi:MAG: EP-phiFL3A [Verrucomicrobiales bacterium]|nr:EP-phiFL3A [Verrucomicrobiales bacterium]
MPAQIADLWTPQIWVESMRERQATFPALFNSGIVVSTDKMTEIATGAGTSANVPFLKDITDQTDEIQVEHVGPVTDNGQGGGLQNFPILNRVTKNSVTALSAQVSGVDPMGAIIDQLTARRLKQRQSTLVAMLRGVFGTGATAANAAGALSAVRLGGTANEPFIEAGAQANANYLIDPDKFIDASTLLGELEDDLINGCILCHPVIKGRLRKLDRLNFKTTVMQSELPWTIETYCGVPIFTSAALVRAGTGDGASGYVYDTYLMSKGTVGYGEKAQQGDTKDVASLQYFLDRDLNDDLIWDRTRFVLGINGLKWVGNPGGQSATNAELQTAASWNLVYQTANRVGVSCIRTNG